ncbi:MAG: hypothetical protein ACREB3_14335, partial [Burkholderiales bacterium]
MLIPIRLIQRLVGWALILGILAFLALFGLQFSHSPKLDTATLIIRLRSYGDPILYDVGSWVGVSWPVEQGSYTFLPLVMALLTWGVKVGWDAALQWFYNFMEKVVGAKKKEAEEGTMIPGLGGRVADSKRSREDLLKRYRELEDALKSSKRKRCAFLSVDVVGSTKMKQGETDTAIAATFQAYEEMLNRIFQEHGAWKVAWTPDGVMVCFLQLDLAVAAGQQVLKSLKDFNATDNKLRTSFRVRAGLNEGEVAI